LSISAVSVRDLSKVFSRRKGLFHRRRRASAEQRQLRHGARRMRRDPRPERLGQVDAGPTALDAAAPGRRLGAHLRPRRVQGSAEGAASREPRVGGGKLLQEDERRRESRVRGSVLRHGAARDAREDPGHPGARRLSRFEAQRVDGEPLARDAAEGGACARPAHLTRPPAARRADDGARPALEAGSADVHPRDPRSPRLDDPPLHARHEGSRGPRGSDRPPRPRRAALPRAVSDVKDRYGVDTLEEAFFAATGRTYEDERTEDDEEREVFA